jgi:hypothetical protein
MLFANCQQCWEITYLVNFATDKALAGEGTATGDREERRVTRRVGRATDAGGLCECESWES